jgi:hypothetical protein
MGSALGFLPSAIAVDDTSVYWLVGGKKGSGSVMECPKTGGAPVLLAEEANPNTMAVDGLAIYWADAGGTIKRLLK